MAANYWPVAVAKDAKNSLFLTKGTSANNPDGTSRSVRPGATLHKSERLCREQLIASLFTAGHRFLSPSLQVVWMLTELTEPVPAQCLVSISRRRFPHAADRNRIKRLMREAYRLNKSSLYQVLTERNLQLAFAFIYTNKSVTTFNDMQEKIQLALTSLTDRIKQTATQIDSK